MHVDSLYNLLEVCCGAGVGMKYDCHVRTRSVFWLPYMDQAVLYNTSRVVVVTQTLIVDLLVNRTTSY